MQQFLQNPTHADLLQAIEANTMETFETWSKWTKLELRRDQGLTWTASDIPYFLFNLVLDLVPRAGSAPEEPGPAFAAAVSRARSRRMPMGWWLGPNNPVVGLARRLEDEGWCHAATLTAMAVKLVAIDEPKSLPSSLEISIVDDDRSLEIWCRLMSSVSEFPDFASAAWLEMYREIDIIHDPQWRLFLASVDGKPVSTSELFMGAGVAGIHGVTTLPEYRGRGIATAMTYQPLIYARNQGYKTGDLFLPKWRSRYIARSDFKSTAKVRSICGNPRAIPFSQHIQIENRD